MGVILDVEVTTGQTNEGDIIEPQVDEVSRTAGVCPKAVTADAGYAYAKVYAAFEKRGIDASFQPGQNRSARAFHCGASATTPRTTF